MGTQNSDKTEQTTKLTKQGVRDLNHLVRTVPPVTSDASPPTTDEPPVVGERNSAPLEP